MTHQYQISGMTCEGCVAHVKFAIESLENITSAEVNLAENTATIVMEKHVALSTLQNALGSKYQISTMQNVAIEKESTWLSTYKPVLLIFAFIFTVTLLIQIKSQQLNFTLWMQHFMAGFFLVFSFFKMLNLKGFAESYVMYDVIAKKIPVWAYLYAFIELALGIAFLVNFNPFITNLVTVVVMSVSIIGVLQTVLNKKKIQCACLGAIFELPMSTVTIIEDGLMIIMSAAMLLMM